MPTHGVHRCSLPSETHDKVLLDNCGTHTLQDIYDPDDSANRIDHHYDDNDLNDNAHCYTEAGHDSHGVNVHSPGSVGGVVGCLEKKKFALFKNAKSA